MESTRRYEKLQLTPNDERLSVFLDRESIKVLLATFYSPRSLDEITLMCNIPRTTCYRKIKKLLSLKLIEVDIRHGKKGRQGYLYKSRLMDATIKICGSRLSIDLRKCYEDSLSLEGGFEDL